MRDLKKSLRVKIKRREKNRKYEDGELILNPSTLNWFKDLKEGQRAKIDVIEILED